MLTVAGSPHCLPSLADGNIAFKAMLAFPIRNARNNQLQALASALPSDLTIRQPELLH